MHPGALVLDELLEPVTIVNSPVRGSTTTTSPVRKKPSCVNDALVSLGLER